MRSAFVLIMMLCGSACSGPMTTVFAPNQAAVAPEVPAGETAWMNGRFTFEDAKGEVVLISAWDPGDHDSLGSMPAVHAIADSFRERGLRLFTVTEVDVSDRDDDRAESENVAMKHGVKYATLFDDDGHWMRSVGISDMPTFLLVDQQGRILVVHRGLLTKESVAFRTLSDMIDELLGTAAPKK